MFKWIEGLFAKTAPEQTPEPEKKQTIELDEELFNRARKHLRLSDELEEELRDLQEKYVEFDMPDFNQFAIEESGLQKRIKLNEAMVNSIIWELVRKAGLLGLCPMDNVVRRAVENNKREIRV
ncbi:hypothetical protein [Weissella tructae]